MKMAMSKYREETKHQQYLFIICEGGPIYPTHNLSNGSTSLKCVIGDSGYCEHVRKESLELG